MNEINEHITPNNPKEGTEMRINKVPPAPQEALIKREVLDEKTISWLIDLLDNEVTPMLVADVSSYAKGRMRAWLPYQAPLDSPQNMTQPFVPGLLHDALWQFIVDICAKHGMQANVALVSKGGNIKPHRDTTYAAQWTMGINLGKCRWSIASTRDKAKPDYHMSLNGGEVFSFNSKHVHQVEDAASDRWAINVWAIANTGAAHNANIQGRLQNMLNTNPQVLEFINKHQPNNPKEETEMKVIQENKQQKGDPIMDTIKPKRKGEEVISFMNDLFHTVTNDPTPQEALGHTSAMTTGKPYLMGHTMRIGANGEYKHNQYLLPVLTGNSWEYGLIMDKLVNRGKKFNLKMIKIGDLQTWIGKDKGDLQKLVDESNFAWANPTHAFFLNTRKDSQWTLSDLGLSAFNMKKTPKRLQELSRYTQIYKSGSIDKIKLTEYTNEWLISYYEDNGLTYSPESDEVIFDGPIFITKSKMIQMCLGMEQEAKRKMIGSIYHGSQTFLGRFTFSGGLIKGLFHVVDDNNIDGDIVYHSSALKKELFRSSDTWTFTAWPLATSYPVSWDIQSALNNPWLFTGERFKLELDSLLADFKAEIAKGEIPTWMKVNADEDQEDNNIVLHNNELADWHSNAQKWQSNGYSILDSSTFIHLAYGQLANRMHASYTKGSFWLPMNNAFFAPVITHDALQILGGELLPESKSNMVWFDPRFGAIIPGNRFSETAELHDTWDQDGDMARFIRIKLWSSNKDINDKMVFGNVIPKDLDVPTTEEEAINVVVIIRSPNGPGGYSINRYDADTMPFMRINESAIQVIDLATATLPMGYLLADIKVEDELTNIINNTQYSNRNLTREDGQEAITNQFKNKGFGSYVNCMMIRASICGPSYPTWMPATGNDIIDACAQTSNVDAFEYIDQGVSRMWITLVTNICASKTKVDKFFANRIPERFRTGNNPDNLIVEFEDGIFSTMMKRYSETLKQVNAEKDGTIFIRQNSKLIASVRQAIPTLTDAQMSWLESFNSKYSRKLRAWDKQKQERRDEMSNSNSRAFKAWCAYFNAQALSAIQLEMAAEFNKAKNPGYAAVSYYRWLTDPEMAYQLAWHERKAEYVKSTQRYGLVDRVLFQSATKGNPSLVDILIGGLKDLGI